MQLWAQDKATNLVLRQTRALPQATSGQFAIPDHPMWGQQEIKIQI